MDFLDYNDRALITANNVSPHFHTGACLSASVDAFCDDVPDPGCICGGEARVNAMNADTIERSRQRQSMKRYPCGWCGLHDCDLDCVPPNED